MIRARRSTFGPSPPSMPANLSSVPTSCFAASASFCGPPGFSATPANAANNAGIPASIAEDVTLRSRPSALAIRPIMSGVRNFIMRDTRFIAICPSRPPVPRRSEFLVDHGLKSRWTLGPLGHRCDRAPCPVAFRDRSFRITLAQPRREIISPATPEQMLYRQQYPDRAHFELDQSPLLGST